MIFLELHIYSKRVGDITIHFNTNIMKAQQLNNRLYKQDLIDSFCRRNSITETNFLACTLTLPVENNDYNKQQNTLDELLEGLGISLIASLEFATTKNKGWHYHFITSSKNIDKLKETEFYFIKGYDLQGWKIYLTKGFCMVKEKK